MADRGRDDNNFEGDGNDLGWGKKETKLADGAKDPESNAGANNSLVKDTNEIGLIFDFEGKKKVCLNEFGSYMKFNNKCLHRGYKRGSVKTYLSALIFLAPMGQRSTGKNTVAKFEEGIINKDNLPVLKSINEDILQGWEEKYKCKKYKAPTWF